MSYPQPNLKAFKAGADLSAKQYHFVKFDTTKDTVVACAGNERAIGILMNKPIQGEAAEVAIIGGGAKLKISEAVGLGKLLTSTAAGQGEVADAAGEWCAALAFEDGVTNDVIAVMVIATQAQASDA